MSTPTQAPPVTPTSPVPANTKARRAALAAFLGGTLEYYDYFIYAAASALIFGEIFFADSGTTGTMLSLATFGVAYVARPFGAVILGHFGDKYGRKKILIVTLSMMGFSTFLIGCLPDYDSIGYFAPMLLVVLRLAQGISAGGETAGASSLTVEHAPANKRGLFASWIMNGISAGLILASLVFIPIAAMPDDVLYSWGWRIPFWSSAIVLLVAYFVRRAVEEPEIFADVQVNNDTAKIPIVALFRDDWRGVLRLAACSLFTMVNAMVTVFALAYATGTVGLDRSMMLGVAVACNVLALFTQPFSGWLSDRFGRRPVFIVGCLGCAVFIFAYFSAIATGNWVLIFGAGLVLTGIFYSMPNGIYPAFFTEMFHVKVRYTGMAVGLQIGLVCAGFTPLLATAMVGGVAENWAPVAWLTAIICVVSAIAAFTARETYRTPLAELGVRKSHAPSTVRVR
ncbi:MFS transporter [Cryobacterium frigoriphilum]|uniref:MFS transporter n=1 Tax=Cryobacterium frigoriphilum TaxID=1259150 RepID=A0A4R9A9Q2_9MICO|nr:MFS transporter [Cryobacterium frigoriphilum]TFD54472.1 MFS transporter [Cryobacterium frigoriphilum]